MAGVGCGWMAACCGVLCALLTLLPAPAAGADICANVRYSYEKGGLGSGPLPKDTLKGGGGSGTEVRICAREPSCCTPEMERRLTQRSRREFDRALAAALAPLLETLRARAKHFDEYFKTMLKTSKSDFDNMFKKTYGIIYEQNSVVFTDLFDELERYYVKGRVDLEEVLDNFFSTLYQKMFTVINAQYRFDDTYLRCVGEHMAELKPFGDVPAKMSVQLRRAFVATRTFAQSLSMASDVVSNMAKIPPSPECLRALTKMSGCPTCTGLVEVKACNNYCINVMKGCLAYHVQLNNEWNTFVDALDQLVDRLKGPFNIEIVVNPINIKISEAIMNFQESGSEVSHRVFQGCGKPELGRRRRDTSELDFSRHSHRSGKHRDRIESENEVTLEALVKDIRVKVNDTRQFWANLPYQVCNDDRVAASPALDDSCWNGEKKARYEVQVSKEQRANPEVSVDPSRESVHLNEQLFVLRTLISKLKSAHGGRDVDWIDNEDSMYGSGSGSGDGTTDPDDNDSEREGSGDDYSDRGYGGYDPSSGRPDPNRPHEPPNRNLDHPISGAGSPGAAHSRLSPARAVSSYLLPIVVVWFGGIFSDWL